MCGIRILQQDFVLKTQGGLMREGGAYLRDTTVSETLRICIYIEDKQHAIIKLGAFTISTFVI